MLPAQRRSPILTGISAGSSSAIRRRSKRVVAMFSAVVGSLLAADGFCKKNTGRGCGVTFGPKRKRSKGTFKARVTEFWQWFPDVAKRFEIAAETDDPQEVVSEVGDFMEACLPGLSWALGRG